MADRLGEKKLEFQEGLGPAHVHEVLCKQHPDIASTAYELCWMCNSRTLEVISSPPRGFTVDFLKTFLNHSKCYVRPIQGSLKSVEYSVSLLNSSTICIGLQLCVHATQQRADSFLYLHLSTYHAMFAGQGKHSDPQN